MASSAAKRISPAIVLLARSGWVLIRRVVDDQVDEHANPTFAGRVRELDEVIKGDETVGDAVIVLDIVPVVTKRAFVERQKPDAVDAELGQVVNSADGALKIPDPVPVSILKGGDVNRIEDRVFVPELLRHGPSLGAPCINCYTQRQEFHLCLNGHFPTASSSDCP